MMLLALFAALAATIQPGAALVVLQASADSTAAAVTLPETTTRLLPIVVTLLTSLTMAGLRLLSPAFKTWSAPVQTAVLGVVGIALAFVSAIVGGPAIGADPASWETALEGLMAALAAHLIYRRGKAPPTK